MAAPNIVNVTSIIGKTAVLAVPTTATALVTNAANSNKVFKLNGLFISNVDGAASADITVELFRSSVAYRIVSQLTVPAKTSMDLLTKPLYLEEGDSLRVAASATLDLEAICSYEEIS